MEILSINSMKLQNEEHFKFQTDFKGLIDKFSPRILNISPQYVDYMIYYNNEQEALDVVRKSAITEDLTIADILRDSTYRGLVGTVKAALSHYNTELRASATRIQVVFDNFGNIAVKPYEKETVAINQLVMDLLVTYPTDVAALGLTEWVTELKAQNTAFDNLKKLKHTEESVRTSFKMKTERGNVDQKYRAIIKRINAHIEINGLTTYLGFVIELNNRISVWNHAIAQREGRNAKKAAIDENKILL